MLLQIPQSLRPISLSLTPPEAARRLRLHENFVFLDSSLEGGDSISILAVKPAEIVKGTLEKDWHLFEQRLAGWGATPANDARGLPSCSGGPAGAAIGWIGYDGKLVFGIYPELLVYHHATQAWHATGDITDLFHAEAPVERKAVNFQSQMAREKFCEMVRRAKEYIAAGDIYQVCLAYPFLCEEWNIDSWAFYERFRNVSPVPHGAFLRMDGGEVMSGSPETFLRFEGRRIITRPIKGTRARYADDAEDAAAAKELMASAKEAAELVMITDLERNDLGRVCEYGSVKVGEMLALEKFEQVYHLVSTVEGRLRADCTQAGALKACFPGGSISGAPKIRACQIISELEPFPRNLYTGAIGYFGFDGRSQFNIAIRTVAARGGRAEFYVGAGIVADSSPEREWQETLEKAAGILQTAQGLA